MKKEETETEESEEETLAKEGYVMKKQHKSVFGAWHRKYLVLEKDSITFFEDATRKAAGKIVPLSSITAVSFHYDEKAPVKSKKRDRQDKDETRFDVYTTERVYMLKADGDSFFEANAWVEILSRAGKQHNPKGFK